MTLRTVLKRLHLQSPQPEALASFYARAYGMEQKSANGIHLCKGALREVSFAQGQAGQLHYALFVFHEESDWQVFLKNHGAVLQADIHAYPELPAGARAVRDPEGTLMVFVHETKPSAAQDAEALPPAMVQHFALRTTCIEAMLRFYTEQLGFTVSDRVLDDNGTLMACFMRTHSLHHNLALFSSSSCGFDHQSFETPSWEGIKLWADHMSREYIPIVWGVGRHGPGDNVFFMVRDPDRNLVEISSEIEVCAPERPVGIWKHEERSLNLWGNAIMRS